MQNKKILILAPFYPPNLGGAETFAEGLARYLSKDHNVVVLAFKSFEGEGIGYEIRNDNLRIIRMDWGFKMGKAWSGTGIKNALRIIPKMLLNAIELQKKWKFDIVLCNGLNAGFIGAILKVFYKMKVGCILLALYEFRKGFSILGTLAGGVLKRMDKIYVEGEGGVKDILPLGIDLKVIPGMSVHYLPRKIVQFQHWVDQEIFKPKAHGGYFMCGNVDREIMHKIEKERKIRVLFVGRPIFEKGIHLIKDVENAMKGEVEFEFIQDVPYEELPKHYQMADVLVVPSLYAEGFVRVVAEGASCGCAVITSNMGSLNELVKDFGWAIPARADYFDMAIYSLDKDRELLKKHQGMSLEYAKMNFSEKNAGVFLAICS